MDEYSALLERLVKESRDRAIPDVVERDDVIAELPEPGPFNLVHIITGVRRCGKTFYLFQLMKRLLASGVSRDRILYFNFADDRLDPVPKSVMDDVLEEYCRQVPKARAEGMYLLLDEVQEMPGWQGFCKRVAENECATLVITGSSSKLSAEEISTQFRGRSLAHMMTPLSFREFCRFQGVVAPRAGDSVSRREEIELEALFDRYLVEGGFPDVQGRPAGERTQLLQEYARNVVARDVAERIGRGEMSLANRLALFCLRNTGCELSVNGLVEQLQKLGYRAYWEKVNRILELFAQSYLVSFLPEYSTALGPGSTIPQKVYSVDPGIAYAVSRASQRDLGKRFETAVYNELTRRVQGRRTDSLTSYTAPTQKREKVDFLLGDVLGDEPYELVQVTAGMEAAKTRARELASLAVAMEKTGVARGTVVTLRERGSEKNAVGMVAIVPAWRWMLEL